VDGEWNGKLMAKYASGEKLFEKYQKIIFQMRNLFFEGFNDVFMDVSKIPIHPKKCRKVLQQDPFESRRLWREVTYGLKVSLFKYNLVKKTSLYGNESKGR